MNKNKSWLIVIYLLLLVGCVFTISLPSALKKIININDESVNNNTNSNIETTVAIKETDETPALIKNRKEQLSGDLETMQTISTSIVNERDIQSINQRFKEGNVKRATLIPINHAYKVGDERKIWILNTTSNSYKQITAKMVSLSSHTYFWIQEGLSYDLKDISYLADIFETRVYPTDHAFFGTEPIPGIDGDIHISIVYAMGMGRAAGFFSSSDTVTQNIDEYSNQAEMFYISADYVDLSNHDQVGDIMAHEMQHMILYALDKNETSWVTEGFSGLATYLNGYGPSEFDPIFAANPNTQLTFWPDDQQGDSSPNYGAAFMFMKYFLDRFGESATKALVAETANDYQSVDLVLQELNFTDPVTSMPVNGDEFFRDWSITNLVNNDPANKDIRYQYKNFRPPFFFTEKLTVSQNDWLEKNVNQFGTRYYEIDCYVDCVLNLKGTPIVQVLPTQPHSGKYYFWSNKGDESEMTLSREFDFRAVSGPITFDYWTWYDIEKNYDYVYLTASVDGKIWKIIHTTGCTESNPTGANYGCGYSGKSNGWIEQKVDLSEFAGKKVTLKFDYITDLAVNGEGLVLDDISIPEIGFWTDFESDAGGWMADGFVRIQNKLPQDFLITYIHQGKEIKITPLSFNDIGYVYQEIPTAKANEKNYLVISGMTRYTITPADFEIKLSPNR